MSLQPLSSTRWSVAAFYQSHLTTMQTQFYNTFKSFHVADKAVPAFKNLLKCPYLLYTKWHALKHGRTGVSDVSERNCHVSNTLMNSNKHFHTPDLHSWSTPPPSNATTANDVLHPLEIRKQGFGTRDRLKSHPFLPIFTYFQQPSRAYCHMIQSLRGTRYVCTILEPKNM